MANFNKVVKVLNIKSAVSLQLTAMEKRNREFETTHSMVYRMRCLDLSIALALSQLPTTSRFHI